MLQRLFSPSVTLRELNTTQSERGTFRSVFLLHILPWCSTIYLPHTEGQRSETYIVELIVQAAGIAHRVAIRIAPPEGGGGRLAVGTAGACSSGSRLWQIEETFRFTQSTSRNKHFLLNFLTVYPLRTEFFTHGMVWRLHLKIIMWGLSDGLQKQKKFVVLCLFEEEI